MQITSSDIDEWKDKILVRKNSITVPVEGQKPLHEREPIEFAAIIIGGSLLSFNAGFLNAVTLMSSGLTSSHVTGLITKSSIFLEEAQVADCVKTLVLLLMFIMGSTVSGIFIPYSSFHLGRAYNIIFLLGTGCLLLALLLHVGIPDSTAYVYVTTMACGMQNAMTTKYSNNILRTTHMTGAATDIGIVLGRIIVGRRDEIWRLYVLGSLVFSYFIGGVGGAGAAKKFGGTAVAFNLMIFAGTGLLYALHMSRARHITLLKAIFLRADVRISDTDRHVELPPHDAIGNPMMVDVVPSFEDKNGSGTDDDPNGHSHNVV